MTDNAVPNSMPDPMEESSSVGHEAVNPDLSAASEGVAESDWETVNFPGQISVDEDVAAEAPPKSTEPAVESTVLPPANRNPSEINTNELIQLIQDLNHCNDALLNRVSDLEEALERSQAALQVEIERNHPGGMRDAGPMPQQVAQLLSELDIASDGLRRTTMHNEALQAELDVSQQRIAQLERECTLLQQRFNEKSNALQQAESTCRDLKSRLHRQQRYTLQFKAALEKCLNMPANPSGSGAMSEHDQAEPSAKPQPVSMPRSQHIQPWSAGSDSHPDEVSLTDLLRSVKTVGQGTGLPFAAAHPLALDVSATQSQVNRSDKASDPEAEALLWQDLERVTESQPPVPSAVSQEDLDLDPWHSSEGQDLSPELASPAAGQREPKPEELTFTEPSPWGAPLPDRSGNTTAVPEPIAAVPEAAWPEADSAHPPEPPSPTAATAQSNHSHPSSGLPDFLQDGSKSTTAAPAPLVYPLRSQKKRKSLAAVELPSFGRSARRR